ncbi:MAG: AAA family ATPase, partial [Myxococcales bacterium]|nr:AAA family ATPase [Myxococcales bacterium]
MDLLDRRFLFVVGKGGVGKTTVATALALEANRRDKKVLLAMVNCKERVS